MFSTQKYLILFLTLLFFGFFNACTRDKTIEILSPCEQTITYEVDMQLIIDNNCSVSGCHDGYNGIGDYNNYEGVSAYFSEGNIKNRVLGTKDMPPLGFTPLTEEALKLFECWIIDGYPEK